MQKHMNLLGGAGLLPFAGIPTLILLMQLSYYEGFGLFTLYSAIILSFLGGVHWYDAINRTSSTSQLYIAMLPSIIAWLAIGFTHGASTLLLLANSFLLLLLYDFKQLAMTPAYSRLRAVLTGVVIGSHLVMLWLA